MCMMRNASSRDARQEEEAELGTANAENNGGGGGRRVAGADAENNNGGGLQEYVMVTPLDQEEGQGENGSANWHSTDVEEAETSAMAMEDDIQFGYLQISTDNPAQPIAEEHENGNQDANGGQHLLHDHPGGRGQVSQGAIHGSTVTNGREIQSRIVTVNGMQFHVYGNVSGLELLGHVPAQNMDLEIADSEEEEEEERRRMTRERAIAEAEAADTARRTAPLSPEHRSQIVNAMKGISLDGYRPTWADSVPEDQWIRRIKDRGNTR